MTDNTTFFSALHRLLCFTVGELSGTVRPVLSGGMGFAAGPDGASRRCSPALRTAFSASNAYGRGRNSSFKLPWMQQNPGLWRNHAPDQRERKQVPEMYKIGHIGRWETLPEAAVAIYDRDLPKLEAM